MKRKIMLFFRRNKKNLLLLFISSVISLIVGFMLFNLYFYTPLNKNTRWQDMNSQFDSELGWTIIKSRSSIAFDNKSISSNSDGFRSPEINHSAEHLIIIGDSVVWGYSVSDNETVSYYLQEMLPELQVQNLGVSGYGIDQYYLHLKKNINKLNPKYIIVVVYTANDFRNTQKNAEYGRSKPLFIVEDGKLNNINPKIRRYSCRNFLSKSLDYFDSSLLNKIYFVLCMDKKLSQKKSEEVISALFAEINNLALEYNSTLLFVLSPSIYDYDKERYDLLYFRSFFENNSYDYLDYLKEVIEKEFNISEIYWDKAHYSPYGNKQLAKTIYNHLSEEVYNEE